MKCPKCGYPVLPKFTKCPHCGEVLVKAAPDGNEEQKHEALDVVSGRAIWNLQSGEVAHLVTESELENATGLKGVIVQQGCSAIAFAGGKMVTMMQAGVYSFEQAKNEQTKFHVSSCNENPTAEQGLTKFLFSKKKDEKAETESKRIERTADKVSKLPSLTNCRIYLVSNRNINVMFNANVDEEGNYCFAPIKIASKTKDIDVAVSLQLQVTNMVAFVTNYLADTTTVSEVDLQRQLFPCVKSTLSQLLRNLDYQQDGLPEPVVNNLKNRLKQNCNEQLTGIEVVKVLDITDSNEDFERFKRMENQLFVSEKELSYQQRMNEFRNRLETEKNKRDTDQAANEEALRKQLQEINKDKLLHEDEMEQFVALMDSQKRLREAKTKEDEFQALSDMKKSHLVTEEDIAALENTMDQHQIDRENIVDLMRIEAEHKVAVNKQIAELELSDKKQDHDRANALSEAMHKGKLTGVELDTKRLLDAYEDERRQHDDDYAFAQQQRQDDYQFQQQQRQDERDFQRTKQNDDYDFAKRQREESHQLDMDKQRQQADFETRVQNEDYDFKKQQRQDQREYARQQHDFENRKQNEDYDFEKRKKIDEHQFEQDQRKYQTRVQNEDYDFQKMQREQALKEQQNQADYARKRQDKMDDMDILERKAAIAQRNMKAMKEAEMAELQEKNRSTETMQSMNLNVEMNRDNLFANMTPEQIRAAQLSHLSSEAQAEMAKSYSSEKENKLREQQQADQKALYEQMMRNQMAQSAQSQEMMMKMAQMMKDGMVGIGQQQIAAQQQRYDDQVAMKQEYRENAQRQQARTDHTQDSALENISRVSAAAAGNMNAYGGQASQPQQQPQSTVGERPSTKHCPSCGAEIDADETFCPECGSRV